MSGWKPLPEFINGFKVIKDLGTFENGKRRRLIAECKICLKHFEVDRDSLKVKARKGCGCQMPYDHRSTQIRTNIPNRLRSIYSGFMARCGDPDHRNYKNYGAKGIRVCDEWYYDNKIFFKWALENGYSDLMTIDRIDSSKGYFPENCRWITMQENIQARRSITKLNSDLILQIRKDCKIMTTRLVAKKYGISHHHLIDIKLKRSWNNIQDK